MAQTEKAGERECDGLADAADAAQRLVRPAPRRCYVRHMEFGILGPLVVSTDGRELPLAAPQQRTLLAVLLLHAGEPMSAARLIDALWGEQPPATAVKAVQVRISQLRKTLGEGVIETHPLGLRVRVEEGALDLQPVRAAARARAGGCSLRVPPPEAGAGAAGGARALARASRSPTSATRRSRRNEIGRLEELRVDRAGAAARGRPRRSAVTPRRCRSWRRSSASTRCARACAGC